MILAVRMTFSQAYNPSWELRFFPFINYNLNRFEMPGDNKDFTKLFSKFDTMLQKGSGAISIVHIGGSHIQADIYTHRVRQLLQSMYPGILGSRGFFFPYKIAHTNSPSNLRINYTGEWLTSKNTQAQPALTLGLSGITTSLVNDSASIGLIARYDSIYRYDFNKVRIYCSPVNDSCLPRILPPSLVSNSFYNTKAHYLQFDLNSYIDSLNIKVYRGDSLHPFELYGISLDNDDPGITYNAIGVNGAMLKSYLQCNLFAAQLQSLEPDWIIISIGTNEGNTRNFNADAYRQNYIKMIRVIRECAPDAALLLTVPNDSYLNKRYINHNTSIIRDIIYEIARENSCGVWDFYTIMGGLNSARAWYNNGLMAKDHIHFNKPGYILKGELFYTAFMESWSNSIK